MLREHKRKLGVIFSEKSPEKFDGMGKLGYTVSDCVPHKKEKVYYGIQQSCLSAGLSARPAAGLFSDPRPVPGAAEPGAAGGQPVFLLVGGRQAGAPDGPVHCRQLPGRPAGGAGEPAHGPVRGALCLGGGAGPAGVVQVRRFPGPDHPRPGLCHPHSPGDPAHRHLLLHLPGPQLCDRRVPGGRTHPEKSPERGPVRGPVSPAGGRPHCAVHHRHAGDRPSGGVPGGVCRRGHPLLLRPGQEDGAGQLHGTDRRRGLPSDGG